MYNNSYNVYIVLSKYMLMLSELCSYTMSIYKCNYVRNSLVMFFNLKIIYKLASRHGSQAWLWQTVASVAGLILSERLFIPWIYKLQLTSVYEVPFP